MNWFLRSRRLVAEGMMIAVIGVAPAMAQEAATLRVGTYGGGFLASEKANLGKTFTELTGVNIDWTAGNSEVFANKLLGASGRSPPFDVVLLDDPWYSLVRLRGLLEKLDPARTPNLSQVRKEFRLPDDSGTCLFSFTSGIVYNKDKYKQLDLPAPTRWQDLANPKLSGHVGTLDLGGTPPRFVLAAYAIEFGDPPTDWDRAIDAVAKIKFHSFSSGPADLMAKIEAGDVWAAAITDGRASSLIQKGLPVAYVLPDNGNGTKGGLQCTTISVPKGSRNKALAEKFISFALSSGAQLMQATAVVPFGPVIGSLDGILRKAPNIAAQVAWGEAIKGGFFLPWNETSIDKFPHYVEAWSRKVER